MKQPMSNEITLTDADRADLAAVLGDAYAYRLGDADPNYPEDLEYDDREGLCRVRRLARLLGVEPDYDL